MTALEKALIEIKAVEHASRGESMLHRLDPRAKTVVTLLYIIAVLSVSLDALQGIVIFWIFPMPDFWRRNSSLFYQQQTRILPVPYTL